MRFPLVLAIGIVLFFATISTPATAVPAAPSNVQATATGVNVSVSWSAVTAGARYRLYRFSATETETIIATTTATSYTDPGLRRGVVYRYRLRTIFAGQLSAFSKTVAVRTAPLPISNLQATAGYRQVSLTWSAAPAALTYLIYRRTAVTGFVLVKEISETKFLDTELGDGTGYTYSVNAKNLAGVASGVRITRTTPPAIPQNIIISARHREIQLKWEPSATATEYRIARGTSEDSLAFYKSVTSPQLIDPGLMEGTTYYYVVRAVGAGAASPVSAIFSATTAPPIPWYLTATGGYEQVELRWGWSAGAAYYAIFRGVSGGPLSYFTYSYSPQFTDYNLEGGTEYTYAIEAVNNAGSLGQTIPATARTLLSAPRNFTVVASGAGPVSLSWQPSTGATSYEVYRGTGGDAFQYLATVSVAGYTDSSVTAGETYTYAVLAKSSSETSPFSSTASVTLKPAVPSNLVATGGYRRILLSFSPSYGAFSYRVYRAKGLGPMEFLTMVPVPRFEDTNLADGLYHYRVSALNSGGESQPSITVSTYSYGDVQVRHLGGDFQVKCYSCTSFATIASGVSDFKLLGDTIAYRKNGTLFLVTDPATAASAQVASFVTSYAVGYRNIAYLKDAYLYQVTDVSTASSVFVRSGVSPKLAINEEHLLFRVSDDLYRIRDRSAGSFDLLHQGVDGFGLFEGNRGYFTESGNLHMVSNVINGTSSLVSSGVTAVLSQDDVGVFGRGDSLYALRANGSYDLVSSGVTEAALSRRGVLLYLRTGGDLFAVKEPLTSTTGEYVTGGVSKLFQTRLMPSFLKNGSLYLLENDQTLSFGLVSHGVSRTWLSPRGYLYFDVENDVYVLEAPSQIRYLDSSLNELKFNGAGEVAYLVSHYLYVVSDGALLASSFVKSSVNELAVAPEGTSVIFLDDHYLYRVNNFESGDYEFVTSGVDAVQDGVELAFYLKNGVWSSL